MEYVRITSKENENTIVKLEGWKQFVYDKDRGWVQTTLMLDYFLPEGRHYDLYEEISEAQALKILKLDN